MAWPTPGKAGITACATPVGVRKVPAAEAERLLTANVLSAGQPSTWSTQLLERLGLAARYRRQPAAVLAELHRGLANAVTESGIDLVFCCGPLMRNLWDALSSGRRGGYAESAAELESQLTGAIRAGDVIMVKGSLGSRMKTIVTALEKRFPGKAALDDAAV